MSKAKPSPRRAELVASLQQAGREQSNAAVMFHTVVASHLGLSATDEKILDLLEQHGPVTAGQLVGYTGLAPSSNRWHRSAAAAFRRVRRSAPSPRR